MTLVIGTDEAGYGPNLGPLVVSATAWRIPHSASFDDLPTLVGPAIAVGDCSPESDTSPQVRIADSKQLYQPGGSLRGLELPCLSLSTLLLRNRSPDVPANRLAHEEYWRLISADHFAELQAEFWWNHAPAPWPVAVDWAEIHDVSTAIAGQLAKNQVEFVTMQAATIVPQRFNHEIKQHGNKADVLTHVSLQLVARIVSQFAEEPCIILCDRHGGRTRYRDALQAVFADDLIQIWQESSAVSRYRWGAEQRRRECRFMTNGERYLPVALASMNSKYLRELAMLAFNAFWRQHLPDLKKTAGYPSDAKRFRRDVDSTRKRLHIKLSQFWRSR